MKRALLSLLAISVVSAGMAQNSFTIVTPANNAKVREVVRIKFPMNSVGDNGYVGISLNGTFVEAIKPGKGAEYLYYDLNTKGRKIPDGPLTIEAVLYQELADGPRIVDRSSVTVNVANSSSIPVPEEGILVRYKFTPGKQWVYRRTVRIAENNLTEIDANRLSTDNLLAGASMSTSRLMYSVDNAYAGGEGLLRIQALPEKGRDYGMFRTTDDPTNEKKIFDFQMHPIYMRVRNDGRQVFGSIPTYFPLEGTRGEEARTDLYSVHPLPMLPEKRIKVGQAQNVGIMFRNIDLEKRAETNNVVTVVPNIRGELVNVEWEQNHPCAHLRYVQAVKVPEGVFANNSTLINAQRIEEDIYFALDLGTILKVVRTYTIDQKITVQPQQTQGGGAAGQANRGGGMGPSISGATGVPGGGGGGGAGQAGAGWLIPPTLGGRPFNFFQGTPSIGGASIPGQNQPTGGGLGNLGRGRTGGSTTRIVKLTIQEIFQLEK